jgi:hypothetical protein
MIPSQIYSWSRTFAAALAAIAFASALALVQGPAARAAGSSTLTSLDDKAASLPVSTSFAKADGEDGPYVLSVKNTSGSSISVSAKILLSVYFHADSKAKNIPAHAIDAGQTWTIPGLAASDKVTLSADGFAPLELTVP